MRTVRIENMSGFDADLYLKMETKRDIGFERNVITWVEKVLNEELPDKEDLWVSLKSGVVLCKLLNTIKPGTVPSIHTTRMIPLKEMENIQLFLKGIWTLGVSSTDLFITSDLHRRKNMPAVIQCLYALNLQAPTIGWAGPTVDDEATRAKFFKVRVQAETPKKAEPVEEVVASPSEGRDSVLLKKAEKDALDARTEMKNLQAAQELLKQELAAWKQQMEAKNADVAKMNREASELQAEVQSLREANRRAGFSEVKGRNSEVASSTPTLPRSNSQSSIPHRSSIKEVSSATPRVRGERAPGSRDGSLSQRGSESQAISLASMSRKSADFTNGAKGPDAHGGLRLTEFANLSSPLPPTPSSIQPSSPRSASPTSGSHRRVSSLGPSSPRQQPDSEFVQRFSHMKERELENELAAALRREKLALSQLAELNAESKRQKPQGTSEHQLRAEIVQLTKENNILRNSTLAGQEVKDLFKEKIQEEVELQLAKALEVSKVVKQQELDSLLQALANEKESVATLKANSLKLTSENSILKDKVRELEHDVKAFQAASIVPLPLTMATEIVQEGGNTFYYNPDLVTGMENKDIAAAQSKLRQLFALGFHTGLSPDDQAVMRPLFNSDTGRRVFTVLLQEVVNKRDELQLSLPNYKFLLELITTLLRNVESHKEFVTLTVIMDACFRIYYEQQPVVELSVTRQRSGSSMALHRMASVMRMQSTKTIENKEQKCFLQQDPSIRNHFGAMSMEFWEEYFWKKSIHHAFDHGIEAEESERKSANHSNNPSLIDEELLEFAYDMFHWGVALDRVKEFTNNIAYFGLGLGNENLGTLMAKIDDYVTMKKTKNLNAMPTNLQEKQRQNQEFLQKHAEALEQEKALRRSQQCRAMSLIEGELLVYVAATMKGWEKRYISLSRNTLQAFRKPGDKVPLSVMTLSPYCIVEACLEPPALAGQYSFSVTCLYFHSGEFLGTTKPCTRAVNAKGEAHPVPPHHRKPGVTTIPDMRAEPHEKEVDSETCMFFACSTRYDRYRWMRALRAVIISASDLDLHELNAASLFSRKDQGFEIKKRQFSFEDVLEIGSFGRWNSALVKRISLEQCVLGSLTSPFFSALACCSGLTSLDLTTCALLDHGLFALLRLIATSTDLDLIINGVSETDEASEFVHTPKACGLPNLKMLTLTNNGISALGMRAFAHVISSNGSLKEVVLDRNPIKDVGAAWLARALGTNQTIEVLKICGCGFGSDGAIALLHVLDPEFKEKPVISLLEVHEGVLNQTLKRLVTSGNQDVRPDLRARLVQLLATKGKGDDEPRSLPSGLKGQKSEDDLRPQSSVKDEQRTPPPPPPLPRPTTTYVTSRTSFSSARERTPSAVARERTSFSSARERTPSAAKREHTSPSTSPRGSLSTASSR